MFFHFGEHSTAIVAIIDILLTEPVSATICYPAAM